MAPTKKARTCLKIELSNRWARFYVDPEVQLDLKPLYSYLVKNADRIDSVRNEEWDGRDTLFNRSRVPSGLFIEKLAELQKHYELEITDVRETPKFVTGKIEVRDYQKAAVDAMVENSSVGGIIVAATGTGKTRTAAAYFSRLDGCAIFVVDELGLLLQTRDALAELLHETVGIVGKSEVMIERITVATVQTLKLHRHDKVFQKWFNRVDVIVIDELHVMINKRSDDVIRSAKPLAVFGLTATVELQHEYIKVPAIALCGPVIFVYPLQQGVADGHLSRGLVVAVTFPDPLRGQMPHSYDTVIKGKTVRISGSHPSAFYRFHIALNRYRNDAIATLAIEGVKAGRTVVVLVERKDHVTVLRRRFLSANIPHGVIAGFVKAQERRKHMADLQSGKISLVLASRVFGKGADVPRIDMIVDGTGLPGRNATHQRYGRGTRNEKGKRGLLYFDISDAGTAFEKTARSRRVAYRELGTEIKTVLWKNNPRNIVQFAEREISNILRKSNSSS